MSQRPFLLPDDPLAPFPPAELALRQPEGLLAVGGDLSLPRLLNAYRGGIFPWFSEGEPLLWWSPDPRAVFRTDGVHLSRRFRRSLRGCPWIVRADTCFHRVIAACAVLRSGQDGTWITAEMQQAYAALHEQGYAHSIEVFDGEQLIGGLYGLAIGRAFFGESMFSAVSGASKVALATLAQVLHGWGFALMDAQVANPHTLSLGAELWPRSRFLSCLRQAVDEPFEAGHWRARFASRPASALTLEPGH